MPHAALVEQWGLFYTNSQSWSMAPAANSAHIPAQFEHSQKPSFLQALLSGEEMLPCHSPRLCTEARGHHRATRAERCLAHPLPRVAESHSTVVLANVPSRKDQDLAVAPGCPVSATGHTAGLAWYQSLCRMELGWGTAAPWGLWDLGHMQLPVSTCTPLYRCAWGCAGSSKVNNCCFLWRQSVLCH